MSTPRTHLRAPRVLARALSLGFVLCASSDCTQIYSSFIDYDVPDANPPSPDLAVASDLAQPDPAPALSAVTPAIGPTTGGISLSLAGQNFAAGATVTIAGKPATATGSATLLTATLPAQPGAFGLVPVVVQNPDGQKVSRSDLFAYFANQLGFAPAPSSPFAVDRGSRLVITGDVNGDKNLDLVTANLAGSSVSVLLGDGRGGFVMAPKSPVALTIAPFAVAMGDFNGDQKPDLICSGNNSSNGMVLLGDGAGGFSPTSTFSAGSSPTGLAVADFNGDQRLDFAVANFGGGNVSVLLGNGAGSFSPAPVSPSVGTGPITVAAGDLNGNDGAAYMVRWFITCGRSDPGCSQRSDPSAASAGRPDAAAG